MAGCSGGNGEGTSSTDSELTATQTRKIKVLHWNICGAVLNRGFNDVLQDFDANEADVISIYEGCRDQVEYLRDRLKVGIASVLLLAAQCASIISTVAKVKVKSKRTGHTKTISISVDAVTERILKDEAVARYEGNVSRLIAAIALEARKQAAFERILEGHVRMSDREIENYWRQLEPRAKKKRRKAA